MSKITEEIRQQIQLYIEFLTKLSQENENDFELQSWVPNCVECLQFAVDNEALFKENSSPYADIIQTLYLLYSYIVKNAEWAYVELSQKFRKIYSPEEVGKFLQLLLERMQSLKEPYIESGNNFVSFTDDNGDYKPIEQILREISDKWEKATYLT